MKWLSAISDAAGNGLGNASCALLASAMPPVRHGARSKALGGQVVHKSRLATGHRAPGRKEALLAGFDAAGIIRGGCSRGGKPGSDPGGRLSTSLQGKI